MRKIITSEMVTLDGQFVDSKGGMDWVSWDDELAGFAIELAKSIDTILFGRMTYELMANYWPKAAPPAGDQRLIDSMNDTPKKVFSRTLYRADWKNTRLVRDIDRDVILKMKAHSGKNMVIYGSGSIVSIFTNLGLIDEHYLFVNPVVLGKGKPLFKDLDDLKRLRLLDTKKFNNGVVMLHYEDDSKVEV